MKLDKAVVSFTVVDDLQSYSHTRQFELQKGPPEEAAKKFSSSLTRNDVR